MKAAFFGLAFLAALNPGLFAIDLLLENARSRLTCEAACPRVSVRPSSPGLLARSWPRVIELRTWS